VKNWGDFVRTEKLLKGEKRHLDNDKKNKIKT
jgi:hypothetical protein